MSIKKICILDYGSGNSMSVYNAIKFLKYPVFLSNKEKDIIESSHLILPGVGSYKTTMEKIKKRLPLKIIENEVFNKKKPLLGICVGMQVLSDYGYEFEKYSGLGWISGEVRSLKKKPYNVPHVGWNNLIIKKKKNIFKNISDKDNFYFVHSFKFIPRNKFYTISQTNYNENFSSIINDKNIYGFQFHPEKSQISGLKLLKNFIEYT
jgi:glutamine amidotransferase